MNNIRISKTIRIIRILANNRIIPNNWMKSGEVKQIEALIDVLRLKKILDFVLYIQKVHVTK